LSPVAAIFFYTRNELRILTMVNVQVDAEDANVSQGRIFWLPEEHELPRGAVTRARGQGIVEEGIYGRPVVVVSRPAEDSHIVHFQLVS